MIFVLTFNWSDTVNQLQCCVLFRCDVSCCVALLHCAVFWGVMLCFLLLYRVTLYYFVSINGLQSAKLFIYCIHIYQRTRKLHQRFSRLIWHEMPKLFLTNFYFYKPFMTWWTQKHLQNAPLSYNKEREFWHQQQLIERLEYQVRRQPIKKR